MNMDMQPLIERLATSRKISGIRREGETVHYTLDGKPYRVEQFTSTKGLRLRLIGTRGILFVAENAGDMCDFILI